MIQNIPETDNKQAAHGLWHKNWDIEMSGGTSQGNVWGKLCWGMCGENVLGWKMSTWRNIQENVQITMQDDKSLCITVMTNIHRHTDSFWLAILVAQPAELTNYLHTSSLRDNKNTVIKHFSFLTQIKTDRRTPMK